MPLGLFRLRNLSTANGVGVLWAAAMFAWFFLSALYLQFVLGYSPLQVGLAFLPANLIMAAFSLGLSAKLVMRFGIRRPLAVGLSLAAPGLALFARAPVDGNFVDDVLPEHDPARLRRRDGVQPAAAGGDERRRAGGVRPRLGRRQHRVHDGRRARPGDPRQPRRARARTDLLAAGYGALVALNGGYHAAFLVGALFALAAAALGGPPVAHRAGRPAHGYEKIRGLATESDY